LEPRDRGRNLWLDHGNQTVGDDYSMLKKNVKFRKEIGEKVGVGFKQPNSISSSLVPNVPAGIHFGTTIPFC